MSEVILGQMTCPNCGISRGTDLIQCICGYNPITGKVEESPNRISILETERNIDHESTSILEDYLRLIFKQV